MKRSLITVCLIILSSAKIVSGTELNAYNSKKTICKDEFYLTARNTKEVFIENGTSLHKNISVEFDVTPQNSQAKVGVLLRYEDKNNWVYVGCKNATDNLGFASWIVATPKDTVSIAKDIAKLYAHHKRKVRVDCEDNLITLYIDGEQVTHNYIPDLNSKEGAVGFRVHDTGEALISNITYKKIEKPAARKTRESKQVSISSPYMEVTLSKQFPAVQKYKLKKSGTTIDAQVNPFHFVKINGDLYYPRVTSNITSNQVLYSMKIDEIGVELNVCCEVADNVLQLKVTDIKEKAGTLIQTISFPEHQLVTVSNNTKGAMLSKSNNVHSDSFTTLADKQPDPTYQYGNILILNTDKWAATLENNSIYNTRQFLYQTYKHKEELSTSIWGNEWIYRGLNNQITELPYIKVVIAEDVNLDNKVDWQDGIIALQQIYPKPFGAEWVQNSYTTITMNFASFAQYPFLRQLDNIKKFYLATDGFGQMLELKGYQSEGHDSGHPDYSGNYNERAGGKEALALLSKEAKKYNARIGVHINHSESYPEAKAFNNNIVTDIPAWSWLDQSYFINKEADVINGGFKARLDGLHRDIPDLSFVYIDTYREYRWLAYNTAKEFVNNGWAIWTEDDDVFDKEACWIHYQPNSKSLISRFLHHQHKDGYAYHPALMGGYSHSSEIGFMGWQKGRDFNGVIRNFFTQQLPLRYMMQFPLMNLDSISAKFSNNLISYSENGKTVIKKDSHYIMRNNAVFIPWNPVTEEKIYYYNQQEETTEWHLPLSWSGISTVYLYELNSNGRILKETVPVKNGTVSISTPPSKGYVLYKTMQETQAPVEWSKGALLSDVGFDSKTFESWKINSGQDSVAIKETDYGQSFLCVKGNSHVSQTVNTLLPEQSYAASVWVKVTGVARASLKVKTDGKNELQSFVTQSDVMNYTDNTDKYNTAYQRLKVCFTMPAGKTDATITLESLAQNDTSYTAFDDVRLVANKYSSKEGYVYFEDFENVDEGWGPFIASQPSAFTTHLSEKHSPYTSNTINGNWSLKTWRERNGEILRTLPALIQFEPNSRYEVTFNYTVDTPAIYKAVVRSKSKNCDITSFELNRDGVCVLKFTTGNNNDWYIAIIKNGSGQLIIDDFGIKLTSK